MIDPRTLALPLPGIAGSAIAADIDDTGESTISFSSGIRFKPIAARLAQATP